ncbi:MAG: septum site-determining protein MinC [Zoogloeaceae bacterium]|jgi:septum site-determining protein MinC|nr:septum site-determining protein MinC [Zoogloeaceae bacterium]
MKNPPFVCKGSTVSVLVLRLHTLTLPEILKAAAKTFGTRDFFGGKACLLDVSGIPRSEQEAALAQTDWKALVDCFAKSGLKIAGILGAAPELTREAEAVGLVAFAHETKRSKATPEVARAAPEEAPEEEKAEEGMAKAVEEARAPDGTSNDAATASNEEDTATEPAPARDVLYLDRPLRSGQVVYARDSDLVVTAFVSPGAELIADGNIYCFAPMRGRAHAGANGDVNARIFATRFAAEVVAIAHQPLVLVDGIPAALADRSVQVRREGDVIKMEALPS